MKIGKRDFLTGEKTYIMGILNLTPDSFSDGGCFTGPEKGFKRAEQLIMDGADIIDIGGESTRPGFKEVDLKEELDRVLPVLRLIKDKHSVPVSLDTRKWQVAEKAAESGTDLINDVSGLMMSREMAEVISDFDLACCLMHNREEISGTGDKKEYIKEVKDELFLIAERAMDRGIKRERIILDPGIGFKKTHVQNLMILSELEGFKELGFPLLLGASRKSVIGKTLGLEIDEREEATIALSVLAKEAGYLFVRVHNVLGNKRAIGMVEGIKEV